MHAYHPDQLLALSHLHRTELERAASASRDHAVRRDRARAVRLAAKAERLSARAARRALTAPRAV